MRESTWRARSGPLRDLTWREGKFCLFGWVSIHRTWKKRRPVSEQVPCYRLYLLRLPVYHGQCWGGCHGDSNGNSGTVPWGGREFQFPTNQVTKRGFQECSLERPIRKILHFLLIGSSFMMTSSRYPSGYRLLPLTYPRFQNQTDDQTKASS